MAPVLADAGKLHSTSRGGGFLPTGDPSLDGSAVRYLIITSAALQSAFQPLADWKTQRGVPATIRTIEWIESRTRHGVDRAETIRNFLIEAYTLWGVDWVLLGGDTGTIPARFGWSSLYGGGTSPDRHVLRVPRWQLERRWRCRLGRRQPNARSRRV
jgi:hypothetical protein